MNNSFYTPNSSTNFITIPEQKDGYVWLVYIGEDEGYEDFEIIGIYTDEPTANLIADKCEGTAKRIKLNRYADNYPSWHIVILENNEVVSATKQDILPMDSYFIAAEIYYIGKTPHMGRNVSVRTFAKNMDQAIEIAKKVMLRAVEEDLWERGFITLDE